MQCCVLFFQVIKSAGLLTQVFVQGGGEVDSQEAAYRWGGVGQAEVMMKTIRAQASKPSSSLHLYVFGVRGRVRACVCVHAHVYACSYTCTFQHPHSHLHPPTQTPPTHTSIPPHMPREHTVCLPLCTCECKHSSMRTP